MSFNYVQIYTVLVFCTPSGELQRKTRDILHFVADLGYEIWKDDIFKEAAEKEMFLEGGVNDTKVTYI